MNPTHLHLMINHVPVLGTGFAGALLAYALWRRSEELRSLALAIFVLLALSTTAVFLSGHASADRLINLPPATQAAVEEHEDAAGFAITAALALGLLALAQLWIFRASSASVARPKLKTRLAWATAVLSIFCFACAARTADLGGQIRHAVEMGKTSAGE